MGHNLPYCIAFNRKRVTPCSHRQAAPTIEQMFYIIIDFRILGQFEDCYVNVDSNVVRKANKKATYNGRFSVKWAY